MITQKDLDSAPGQAALRLSVDGVDLYLVPVDFDPSVPPGLNFPEKTIAFRTDVADLVQKTGPGDTDWGAPPSSGGGAVSGSVTTTTDLIVASQTFVRADTSSQAIQITLPDPLTVNNRLFHIKWAAGVSNNKVTVVAAGGSLIDDQSSYRIGKRYDSIQVISFGTGYNIV